MIADYDFVLSLIDKVNWKKRCIVCKNQSNFEANIV